ncbi:MAG: bacteriohemerythrin [Magnetococcales bacterium]|nr:bacteriohemerythrin [Magnetococcales bacterium]
MNETNKCAHAQMAAFVPPGVLMVALLVEASLISLIGTLFHITNLWFVAMPVALLVGTLFGLILWRVFRVGLPGDRIAIAQPLQNLVETLPKPVKDEAWAAGEKRGVVANIQHVMAHLVRSIRVIGMQAANASALIMELIQVHKFIGKDSNSLYRLAGEIDQSNNQLAGEVAATLGQLSRISMNMDVLASSSSDISAHIGKVAQASESAEHNLQSMALASEKMVGHLQGVFEQLHLSRDSTSKVSQSTEKMVRSFDDVRSRCRVASEASSEADQATRSFGVVLGDLASAARQIGTVVDFIRDITDQTSMLALNAAIEAAGAGDAGRGFAVVANEIKVLAQRTVQATSDIEGKIKEIQSKSVEAGSVAGTVFELVGRIHGINQGISKAIDGQLDATQHVARSADDIQQAMSAIMQRSNELQLAARSVAEESARGVVSIEEITTKASHVAQIALSMEEQTCDARKFAVSTCSFSKKTNELSQQVKEKLAVSLRTTRFLHGSVNHFGMLSGIAREINDHFHKTLSAFEGYSEPFELFRFKGNVMNMMGQLEKAVFGSVKLKSDSFAAWETSEVGKWLHANRNAPPEAQYWLREIEKSCQAMHDSASQAVQHLSDPQPELLQRSVQDVHSHRRRMFAAMDGLYLVPLTSKLKRTPLVEWESAWNIGVPEVDHEHQTLFGMLNIAHNAIHYPDSMGVQKEIFKDLFQYAQAHFEREERLMETFADPKRAEHRAQHRGYLEQAGKFSERMGEESHTLLLDMTLFVRNWFAFHITQWDQEMGRHIARAGRDGLRGRS